MNSDIAKIDSKGRVLIPAKIRKSFGVKNDDKVIIMPEDSGIKIMPITKINNTRMLFTLTDFTEGVDDVSSVLSEHGIDIIASWSRRVSGNMVEWDTILHTNGHGGKIYDIKKKLKNLDTVKDVVVKTI